MIPLLLACAPDGASTGDPPPTGEPVFSIDPADPVGLVALEGPRLLRRLSLDLRGVLPSAEELDAAEGDPAAVYAYRDSWLDDPRFEERLVHLLASSWHTRIDDMPLVAADYGLDPTQEYTLARSAGEEPLRLMAHIAASDIPWTDITTVDYTMANETLGAIWPLDYPADATGWQEARYTDGRPALGVLATNGLWWRYDTSVFNFSRTRAAATVRLLLCDDYLQRPVTLTAAPAIADVEGTQLATATEPTCLACHASLDPIAVSLFGFWPFDRFDPLEMDHYHPEREPLGAAELGVDAAWFGEPLNGPAELGAQVAADPRFARCAVQTMAEALWRRPEDPQDWDRIEAIRRDFVAGGYRVMAGGVDGLLATRPGWEPGVTWALVTRTAAHGAGDHVAAQLGTHPLLAAVDAGTQPGDDAFTTQLRALHWRLFGVRTEPTWEADMAALWSGVAASDGAEAAWSAVLRAAAPNAGSSSCSRAAAGTPPTCTRRCSTTRTSTWTPPRPPPKPAASRLSTRQNAPPSERSSRSGVADVCAQRLRGALDRPREGAPAPVHG